SQRLDSAPKENPEMTTNGAADPNPSGSSEDRVPPPESTLRRIWHKTRNRILEGLLVLLPILVTLWVLHWLYKTLELYVIDPFMVWVIWKAQLLQNAPELPFWFEKYAAPIIAVFFILVILTAAAPSLTPSSAGPSINSCCGCWWFRRSTTRCGTCCSVLTSPKGQPTPQRV